MNNQSVSIVVPTLNEEENLPTLLQRIDDALRPNNITYEVIIVDDHSTDNTAKVAEKLKATYPISLYRKRGTRGKAHSLLEGFDKSRYGIIAMIDADLQYPPEALAEMHTLLNETGADVVVTRRYDKQTSALRKLSSTTFNLVFSKMLFGIDFDTQSGLKMFKKEVLNNFQMNPSPWSFDQEFIVRSLEHKFKIISHTIPFSERSAGVTKVKLFNVTYELARASLVLRWNTSKSKINQGSQANNKFIKHTLPLSIVAGLLSGFILLTPVKADALSLNDATSAVGQLLSNVLDGGSDNTPTNNDPAPTPTNDPVTPVTNTVDQTVQQVTGGLGSGQLPSTTNSSTQPTSSSNATPNSATNSTTSTAPKNNSGSSSTVPTSVKPTATSTQTSSVGSPNPATSPTPTYVTKKDIYNKNGSAFMPNSLLGKSAVISSIILSLLLVAAAIIKLRPRFQTKYIR